MTAFSSLEINNAYPTGTGDVETREDTSEEEDGKGRVEAGIESDKVMAKDVDGDGEEEGKADDWEENACECECECECSCSFFSTCFCQGKGNSHACLKISMDSLHVLTG